MYHHDVTALRRIERWRDDTTFVKLLEPGRRVLTKQWPRPQAKRVQVFYPFNILVGSQCGNLTLVSAPRQTPETQPV